MNSQQEYQEESRMSSNSDSSRVMFEKITHNFHIQDQLFSLMAVKGTCRMFFLTIFFKLKAGLSHSEWKYFKASEWGLKTGTKQDYKILKDIVTGDLIDSGKRKGEWIMNGFWCIQFQGYDEVTAEAIDEDFSVSYLQWKQTNDRSSTTQQVIFHCNVKKCMWRGFHFNPKQARQWFALWRSCLGDKATPRNLVSSLERVTEATNLKDQIKKEFGL